MLDRILDAIIMSVMQWRLNRLRKTQDTPYIFIKGTYQDYPKYLMYTDDKHIRAKMHRIP